MKLAERINKIKPSPTLAVTAKANALRAAGRNIISFGAGEPDFDTPLHIKQEAIRAIERGFTKYTPVGGIDELKDAIVGKFASDNRLSYKRSQIVVSCGAKHTLYNLAQVLFEEGDEVLIPAPYWVSYPDIVALTGATPVIMPTRGEDNFKIDPLRLEKVLTAKTKAIILNSPSNPTGATYSLEELERIADIVLQRNVMVVSDDIYEKILYDGAEFHNIANVHEKMKEQTVVVNGVSKAYAMTGWRIGYAAGPEDVIAAMTKLQSQNTSNPTSIAQVAATEALRGSQDTVGAMVAEFRKRRDYIVGELNRIEGVNCILPSGAFYVFPDVSGLYGKSYEGKTISSSTDLAEYLLEEGNVAVVPGIAFGDDKYIRLSYATSMEAIVEGIRNMALAVAKLH